jgi:general nucleoside transport system ATP-binding protein
LPYSAPVFVVPRLLIQLLVIWGLNKALKNSANWACHAVIFLSVFGLASIAALVYSWGLAGPILFSSVINGTFLVLAFLLGLRTLRDFRKHEKSELEATRVRRMRELGIAHIPEDRHRRGLFLDFNLAENSILGVHYRKPITSIARVFLDRNAIQQRVGEIIRNFDVRPPNAALPARALSGGNQQKLIIGREYHVDPKLLLVSQPTRGVDIGAIEFIHRQLVRLRDDGCAILLVSAELEEVTSLSDRLLVIHEGKIAGEVDPKVATMEEIGLLMTRGH